jgi:hypothetical protein
VLRPGDDYLPSTLSSQAQSHFAGPHQRYVVLPRAQHHVLNNSPVTAAGAPTCAQTLLTQFVNDPTADLDLSCLGAIRGYGFSVDPAVSTNVFSTADAWEGDPGP